MQYFRYHVTTYSMLFNKNIHRNMRAKRLNYFCFSSAPLGVRLLSYRTNTHIHTHPHTHYYAFSRFCISWRVRMQISRWLMWESCALMRTCSRKVNKIKRRNRWAIHRNRYIWIANKLIIPSYFTRNNNMYTTCNWFIQYRRTLVSHVSM